MHSRNLLKSIAKIWAEDSLALCVWLGLGNKSTLVKVRERSQVCLKVNKPDYNLSLTSTTFLCWPKFSIIFLDACMCNMCMCGILYDAVST